MDGKQSIPGLNRNETDAATAIGAFLLGSLVLLCAAVLTAHLLSGLPSMMVYGILFSVMVFAAVCLFFFARTDVSTRHAGPPTLEFRNPVRASKKARRGQTRRPPNRIKPLL